jgi:hypothetical protein
MVAAGSPQTKYMAGTIRHDCKDALSRIELLLSRLQGGESLNAENIAAELTEVRLEMYEVLRANQRIQELCEQELEARS